MVSMDSAFASSTKPQVLMTMASASSAASMISNPLLKRSPSRTSPSTVFLGQPRETIDTFMGSGAVAGGSTGASLVEEAPQRGEGERKSGERADGCEKWLVARLRESFSTCFGGNVNCMAMCCFGLKLVNSGKMKD